MQLSLNDPRSFSASAYRCGNTGSTKVLRLTFGSRDEYDPDVVIVFAKDDEQQERFARIAEAISTINDEFDARAAQVRAAFSPSLAAE